MYNGNRFGERFHLLGGFNEKKTRTPVIEMRLPRYPGYSSYMGLSLFCLSIHVFPLYIRA